MAAVKEEVHVLVHPHFYFPPYNPEVGRRSRSDFSSKLSVRKSLKHYTTEAPMEGSDALLDIEAAHRFYRAQVKLIARKRGAKLVILRGMLWVNSVELAKRHMASKRPPQSIREFAVNRQSVLIDYAKRKLGKRLMISDSHPANLGRAVNSAFNPDVHFKVFGEYTDMCVSQVARSLRESGFRNVELISEKSIPSVDTSKIYYGI